MKKADIIEELKKYNLLGRSGSGFPTGLKWQIVKEAKAEKKYIICNGAEGEPNVFKDGFILEHYPEMVVEGVKIALETIDNSSAYNSSAYNNSAYFYLRKDYYQKYKIKLKKLIGKTAITLFEKRGGYLAGEETSACQAIEGKRPEPRIKPPFPTQSGLWGKPTLVNNVETFYYVTKIARGEYKKTRFYAISGQVKKEKVYELPEDYSIEQILKETNNWPDFDFFLQVGGGACGEILLPSELGQPVKGIGAIIVFDRKKTSPFSLMKKWADFFAKENCDRCLPCREGVYRIQEIIEKKDFDRKKLADIFFVLRETSLCPLGKTVVLPFSSLISKLLNGQKQ